MIYDPWSVNCKCWILKYSLEGNVWRYSMFKIIIYEWIDPHEMWRCLLFMYLCMKLCSTWMVKIQWLMCELWYCWKTSFLYYYTWLCMNCLGWLYDDSKVKGSSHHVESMRYVMCWVEWRVMYSFTYEIVIHLNYV